MIALKQVSKRFVRPDGSVFTALSPSDLEIQAGEIFGLIGPSGAGKSTLLRLINLLERPDGGQVVVDGQTLTALPAAGLRRARQNIGMIFQQFNLMANRTVADNVAFPLEIAGWPAAVRAARVAECLALWACRTAPAITRRSCPAGKSSGWALPARWRRVRMCCWPTSRPRRWTRPPRAAFWTAWPTSISAWG